MTAVEPSKNLIYALHHPDSQYVYIGQSSSGLTRPNEHFQEATMRRDARYPKTKWIKSLRERGLEPEIVILEECSQKSDLNEAEMFYIAYFKSLGIPLLNLTEGGDGGAEISRRYWADPASRERQRLERTGKKWSPETRAKMSQSHEGKTKSTEARANMGLAAKRRWEDSDYREKQVAAQKASHSSDESRARAAENAKLASHDTHRSQEYRERMSEIAKASCAREEVRQRRAEARKRFMQDPEYIKKLSDARKRWWARRRGEIPPPTDGE